MITLTLSVPNNDALMAAGFTAIRGFKSSTQTQVGPYSVQLSPDVSLVAGTTSYVLVDGAGGAGDWYVTEYLAAGGALSSPSPAQPAYLTDLCNTVRDLLGVTTVEIADAQIQGFAYLPLALARVRSRLATFDTIVAAGGDPAAAALGALAHYVGSLLCPRMTVAVVDMEQFDKYRYQRNRQMDWTATAQALMAKYEELISQAAGEVVTDTAVYISPIVVTGPSSSGAVDTSAGLVPFADPNVDSAFENPLIPYSGMIRSN